MRAARNIVGLYLAGVAMFIDPTLAWRMAVVGGAVVLVACCGWIVATGRSW